MKDKLVRAIFTIKISNSTNTKDILNKSYSFKDEFEIHKDFGGEVYYLDDWKKMRKTNFAKVFFITENNFLLKIPLRYLMPEYEDWEILEFLTILNYEKPIIEFKYYKIGELYNPPHQDSIVKYENKIVKSIFLVENELRMPLCKFVKQKRNILTDNEFENLLESYIFENGYDESIFNGEQDENESYNEDGRSYYDNEHYNDSLDLDQQDPEFWDTI